jgi:DNA-binding MarR family transcriptional regulator
MSDTAKRTASEDVSLLPILRSLMEAYHTVGRLSDRHIQELGLTGSQFDVIVTLGDLPGMTCKELGEKTLITKGTLTPVLDRLETKGLVSRQKGEQDARQTFVKLTPEGQKVYESTFFNHVDYMNRYFKQMPDAEQQQLVGLLQKLTGIFS